MDEIVLRVIRKDGGIYCDIYDGEGKDAEFWSDHACIEDAVIEGMKLANVHGIKYLKIQVLKDV